MFRNLLLSAGQCMHKNLLAIGEAESLPAVDNLLDVVGWLRYMNGVEFWLVKIH